MGLDKGRRRDLLRRPRAAETRGGKRIKRGARNGADASLRMHPGEGMWVSERVTDWRTSSSRIRLHVCTWTQYPRARTRLFCRVWGASHTCKRIETRDRARGGLRLTSRRRFSFPRDAGVGGKNSGTGKKNLAMETSDSDSGSYTSWTRKLEKIRICKINRERRRSRGERFICIPNFALLEWGYNLYLRFALLAYIPCKDILALSIRYTLSFC